jgi:LCP family protein required for cell wall assembly
MKRFRSAFALLFVFMFVFCPCQVLSEAEDTLSDNELTDLLFEMNRDNEGSADFLVLPDDYQEPITGLEGVYYLLLIGVDTDGQGITGRSDTMVLAALNIRQNTIKLISFMRDLYVRIPTRSHNRLNASYAYGGPDLLIRTLQTQFGVPVDGYVAVDFSLMASLVDAIGGIQLAVSEEELRSLNGILEYYNFLHGRPQQEGRLERTGEVRLNGLQAMSYARIRKIDSDYGRVARQQTTLRAIFSQLVSLDDAKLSGLVFQYAAKVKTNVPLSDALELITLTFQLKDAQLSAMTIPVKGSSKNVFRNNSAYIVPNLKRNTEAINNYLYDAAVDSSVSP